MTPADLVSTLVGPGVAVTNIQFSGDNVAAGKVSGGTGIIGFANGIILSSGCISNVIPAGGLNTASDVTCDNQQPGDPDLDALIPGYETLDRCVLEFDFECQNIQVISFQYVFSSEEYNEYGQYLLQRCLRLFRQRRQRGAAAGQRHSGFDQQRELRQSDWRHHAAQLCVLRQQQLPGPAWFSGCRFPVRAGAADGDGWHDGAVECLHHCSAGRATTSSWRSPMQAILFWTPMSSSGPRASPARRLAPQAPAALPNGTCDDETAADCAEDGGVFHPDTTCDDFDCSVLPCPADITGNGAVNTDDLLSVINHWGPCPAPCPADITGNGVVNTDDLLSVINHWGPCP